MYINKITITNNAVLIIRFIQKTFHYANVRNILLILRQNIIHNSKSVKQFLFRPNKK